MSRHTFAKRQFLPFLTKALWTHVPCIYVFAFLVATKCLYKSVCPSVCPLVSPSVRPFVMLSIFRFLCVTYDRESSLIFLLKHYDGMTNGRTDGGTNASTNRHVLLMMRGHIAVNVPFPLFS